MLPGYQCSSATTRRTLVLAVLLLTSHVAHSFYLPGVAPKDYLKGDLVPLFVNSLTPLGATNQQLKSVIPYDYYYERFHMCTPENNPQKQPESLGSILFGDRIFDSKYEVS